MYINFIYKNNTFNFNIKNDVSITYLKNLVSKMIEKDKSSFDLFYNNKILSENNSILFQTKKNETNIPIIISLKKNNTNTNRKNLENKKIQLPLLTLPNRPNKNNIEKNVKSNNLNETDLFSISSKGRNNSGKTTNQKRMDYISINKVFEDVYNNKEDVIYSLMKELRNKILEYDDFLYKNYKNKYDKSGKQLLLYEKNIINFKDKQIKFLQKLLNYFDSKEASFFSVGKINLEDFYLELNNYNNINNNKNIIFETKNKKPINNTKKIQVANSLEEKISKFTIKKNVEDDLYISKKQSEDSIYSNEIVKEKVDKYLNKKKQKKEQNPLMKSTKSLDNKNNSNSKNIINNLNFIENDDSIEPIPKTKQYNNIKSIKHTQINKENNNTLKNIENKNINQISQIPSSKSLDTKKRELKTNYNKNKIDILFDISENSDSNSENDSSIDNVNKEKIKNRANIERNFRERKKTLTNLNARESVIGYKIKTFERKATHRIKKFGENLSDFII